MRIPNEGLKLELLFDLSESYTKNVTEVIKSSKYAMNLIRTFRFKSEYNLIQVFITSTLT